MKLKHILTILILSTFFSSSSTQTVWQETSFDDFIDGKFSDAGANMYISRSGNMQTVNRWDVNGDGYIDILCVNSHPLVEMLDMSIYWGNGKDFSIRNHSYVPANGPMWVTPGDLNDDGEMDLVVANYSNGTWTEMESFVYYGGLNENTNPEADSEWAFYPFKKRVMLPGSNTQNAAIADFNRDGYKDIVFAFSGGFWEYRDKSKEGFTPSRIYWGSQDGFDAGNFTRIWTAGATDVQATDLNKDEWPDLVFSNGEGKNSFIYFGSKHGFAEDPDSQLPTISPQAVESADLNGDGWPDLLFANEKGELSYAYLSDKGKFLAERRLEFQTYSAKDVVVEDFNKDGFNDVFFTNHQYSLTGDPNLANRLINSFLYFGSKEGFSSQNRQEIPTIGAWGANAADLNEDGWVDLLVCNFQEHYSYEVPSFIYWNGPGGFQEHLRTPLYEHGAQGNAIADFDNDGHLDIIITSMMGNSRGDYDPSFLYFGNKNGEYSAENRITLPGREAYEQAMADLDDDGLTDVMIVNRGEVTRTVNELFIYWNKENNFSPWVMSGLPVIGGVGVEVADLDRNGYLDIIISNFHSLKSSEQEDAATGSFIYWGEAEGWPVTSRTSLPVFMTRSPSICDINNDGYLDLIFGQQGKKGLGSIILGDGSRNFPRDRRIFLEGSEGTGSPGVADLNKDGLLDIAFAHDEAVKIYYQQKDGSFPEENCEIIPIQAKTMNIADVNQDSWLDLICPFYKGGGIRSALSTVLLGSPSGYDTTNVIKLPTDGATGSLVSDFNMDGYADIFFYCHRKDGSFDEIGQFGDHHTNSLIYWGSKDGYSPDHNYQIPTVGVHYDMGVDIGNIWNRNFTYEYFSSPYHCQRKKPVSISWDAVIPPLTSLKFQIRTANSIADLDRSEWSGPHGKDSWYTVSESSIREVKSADWIQYKIIFDTGNGAGSPVLKSVSIQFE